MSVIIRLQGLPWSASAMDIRQYFQGLSIPDGGVHIVGGERGDAFIAFGSDEDARQAMLRTNGKINGNMVQLLLSSKTEMQSVIALAREAVPTQAFNKPSASAAAPSTGLPSGPPSGPPPPAAAAAMTPQNHTNFLPDRSVPPPRNMDYPNRNFPSVPTDIRNNLPPPTANAVPGLPPMPGLPPDPKFAPNLVNPNNMNRDPYFVSQDQDNNINRPPMDFRPGDVPRDFPMNRRPNFPPNADPRMEHGANEQRHFGGANMNVPSGGFMNMRDPHLNLPNFQVPNPNQNRNLQMPNAPLQPGDMMPQGKPPGPDGMPPYHTDRKNDFDNNQQGNIRPNIPPVHHMPPANLNRPDQNRPDFQPHGPPRLDMVPPIQRGGGDMLNQPNQPRSNDSTNANLDPLRPMNYMRNEPPRPDMARHDQGRANLGHPEPNMGRSEPNRGDIGRREPPKPETGRHDSGRSYGGRHESRFDSPRPEVNRTDHVRTDQERTESLRLETGRMAANRSEANRPSSSGRSDMSKADQTRSDSSRNDSSKTAESGRHESSRTDSNRSDSGRHDSKSDSGRHDSRSESGRHEFNRYDSGRHESRHDRSRDDGGRYDRHDRGRDDGNRYDRRDSRRDSRYDSHYDGGRHDRYDGGRYDNQHDSGGRYDSARNDSRHDGGRSGDKGPLNRGPAGSRDVDRGGRDSQGKMDSGGSNRQSGPPGDTYKNTGPADLNNRKGRMDMGGNMNRNNRSKNNEYGGDNRRDYNYGQTPSREQGFPGSMSGFEGQRFPDRPLGHPDCPPFGDPNIGDDPRMLGKDKMYEDSDMSGLPRGLLGDAPPGFLPGQSGPPHESHGNWEDDGYGMRDDRIPGDRVNDFRTDWHDEEMNRGPPFSQGGSWNDMPPNQPPYHRNDGPQPFPRNEAYGRYDSPNRNERGGPPPGRMPGSVMDDRKYGPPNDMNFGSGDSGNRRPGNMDDNSMRGIKRGHCDPDLYVEVVGLPYSVGYRDVRRFFSGCTIPRDGLKLINNEKGRRAGNAFIKFASEQDTAEAFSRHGNFMANRYIEIYRCSKEYFDNAIDSFVPKAGHGPPQNKMMKMDNLNENISREPLGLKPNSGSDIPPLVKANKETSSCTGENPLTSSTTSSSTSPIIQIKGIPLNATNDDIVKFLKDVPISNPTTCIVIEHDSRGKNTGIAFVEVMSQKDYDASLTYDGRHMGGRLIRIVEGNRKDMLTLQEKEKKGSSEKCSPNKNAKDVSKSVLKTDSKTGSCDKIDNIVSKLSEAKAQDKKSLTSGNGKKNETLTSHPVPYYCVSLKGLPFAVTTNEIKEFCQGLNIAPRGIQIVYGKDGRTTGQAFVEFVTSTDCEKAVARDKKYVGKRYINVTAVTKAEMMECLKQARQANMQNNTETSNPPPPPFMVHGGKQYEYVRGENFPPSVSIGEILNFFRGYYPIPESIRLHYADDGRPTGNAMIGFLTRDEGIKALEDLNHKQCRKNVVTLRKA